MIKKTTLFFFTQILTLLLSSSLIGQNAFPKGVSEVRMSTASSIPAFQKFEENAGPALSEFFNYLNATYSFSREISWKELQTDKDQMGFTHSRYVEYLNGIPVHASMLIVHAKDGRVISFNGETFTENLPGKIPVQIDRELAREIAMSYVGAKTYKWQLPEEEAFIKKEQNDPNATFFPKAELFYVNSGKNEFSLACRFDIYAQEPVSRQYVYVRATDNKVILSENRIHETEVTGSAVTAYAGTQSIKTDYTGTTYRLRETSRGLGIETYNLQKGITYTSAVDFTDSDNVWNNVNANKDQYATDAHFGAEKTYDFYFSKFNRNSIDNAGFKLINYVHYSTNYVNAYWDGTRMTYGDGDATYNPLTSMDIAGHEITHGLTEKTANLTYSNQSGALNESFSDIFGTAIEFYATPSLADWLIGEDIGAAFRSMSNPNAFSQPDTYLGTYWATGTADYGGVHTNSGVQNYWFYLLSMGGSGTNDIGNAFSVSGIGIDKAAAIAYRSLTTYLTSGSQYADARTYSIQAATDLYGACSPELIATTAAWYAVGVGSNTLAVNPTISYSGSTSFCQGGSLTLNTGTLSNYQWKLNGNAIAGATTGSYTATGAGSYSVSTVVCGTTYTSNPVVISVSSASVSVSAPTTNSCQPIVLTANASSGYAIQWTKNGVDIPGATQSTYTASVSGNYAARISSTIGPATTLTNSTATSIPDNSCPGATSSIVASGLPTVMNPAGISVKINITHTWDGDLKVWLESPNGDVLGLANVVGSSGDNFTNTVFSDAGSAQIPATGSPYTGTYKPWATTFTNCSATTNRFSFATLGAGSINPNGTWKLRVTDNAASDVGTINNWSITFPQTITPSPDCGPVTSSPLAISIGTGLTAGITPSGSLNICSTGSVTLTATGGTSFLWSTGATTSSITTSTAGNYNVTVSNAQGCSGSANATVSVTNATTWYADVDGDTYGNSASSTLACSQPNGYVAVAGDCNDNDASVHSAQTYYVDADGDGFGSSTTASLCSSTAPNGYSTVSGDCNDADSGIHEAITYYIDSDHDGYAAFIPVLLCSSTAPLGYSSIVGDCNDGDASVHFSQTYYVDADGDGFGSSTTASICSSTAPNGYSTVSGDCNDADAGIHEAITYYIDADHDGFAAFIPVLLCSSTAPLGYSSVVGDCNDGDASVHFSQTYFVDADGDGFGSSTTASICSSTAPNGYSTVSGDCNDTNENVNPGKTEICGNNIDDNCNGSVDEGCTLYTYYLDSDNDGYGTTTTIQVYQSTPPVGYVNHTGDCNDSNAAINPEAAEICGNSIDENCNGTLNEGCVSFTYYADVDNDTYGNAASSINSFNSSAPSGYTSNSSDCNDNNASVNPAASEICGNGIDDNCNGTIDENGTSIGSITAINGPAGVCKSQAGVVFSVDALAGATTYTWTVPAGSTLVSGQGTSSITVNFSATQAAGNICVTASNACSSSAQLCRNLLVYTVKPVTPGTISGSNIEACPGTTRTFSIAPVANTTSYTWTAPANATVVSGQGTTSASLSFGAAFTTGSVSITASNCIGTSAAKTLALYSKPGTPASIAGAINGVCGGTTGTYSCPAVTGATSYVWTVPAGWTINSGQGTNSISLTAPASYVSAAVSVAASSACGTSTVRTITVRSVPAVPGTITGPANTVCSGGSYTYSIVAVAGATSYTWTLPLGWSINSGQGTTSVNITPSAYTSGVISVVSVNACGSSTAKTLTVTSTPATPGTITGPINNICGAGTFTYTIAAVANATSYNWTVPAGCTLVTNNGTSMTMSTSAAFNTGNVTVAAVNACGAGTAKTLAVSKLPATPGLITGSSTVCSNQQGVAYSTVAIAGLTYTWTVPAGASIASGQGTSSILVNFGATVGAVSVKASNACGISAARSFTVTKLACRISADGTEISDVAAIEVYPNPGQGAYTLRLNGIEGESKASIYSMTGQLVKQIVIPERNNLVPIYLNEEADGIYLIRFESAGFVSEVKVIKN